MSESHRDQAVITKASVHSIKRWLSSLFWDDTVPNLGGLASHYAAWTGDLAHVVVLFNIGSIRDASEKLVSELHLAVWNMHTDAIKLLLSAIPSNLLRRFKKHKQEIDMEAHGGWTPLHLAAWNDDVETIKLLLSKGANINATDHRGWRAIHWAAASESLEAIKILGEKDTHISVQPKTELTPSRIAIEYSRGGAIKPLIRAGSDTSSFQNSDGLSRLELDLKEEFHVFAAVLV